MHFAFTLMAHALRRLAPHIDRLLQQQQLGHPMNRSCPSVRADAVDAVLDEAPSSCIHTRGMHTGSSPLLRWHYFCFHPGAEGVSRGLRP